MSLSVPKLFKTKRGVPDAQVGVTIDLPANQNQIHVEKTVMVSAARVTILSLFMQAVTYIVMLFHHVVKPQSSHECLGRFLLMVLLR